MTTPACSVRSLQDGDSGDKSSQNCKKLKARCLGRYVQLHNASSGFNGGIRSVFRRQIGADDWHGGVWCGLEFIGDGCCGRRSPLRCCHGSPAGRVSFAGLVARAPCNVLVVSGCQVGFRLRSFEFVCFAGGMLGRCGGCSFGCLFGFVFLQASNERPGRALHFCLYVIHPRVVTVVMFSLSGERCAAFILFQRASIFLCFVVAEVQGRRHLEVELAWTRTTYTRTNLLASGEVRQSGAERCGNGMLVQSVAWDYRGKYASLGLWSGTRRPGADPVG
ncbi:Hypp6748 [Branchiostoma lanceolatum]|uniref:Hypp6748 protein n=1 Tax=Branchiostoma lanceolatum TaxID=7740 RepID=A0A8K0EAL5_BRALA|nr:Hypp6748 [Branchiostoma lanceolatum]